MRGLRTDIQVLRAIAVLSVLAFHFDVPGLHKGFLGVDVFFVISGYLMSGVILREQDEGRFRMGHFYLRRARRLLPAAFATLLGTTLVAPFILTPSMLADYGQQLLGALTFSANIMLWWQSGYFDGEAISKPLLHTWSLALEEQFYFLLPLVLYLCRPRWRLAAIAALLMASSVACWVQVGPDPSGTFYLLHTRAWELLIGAVCAWPARSGRTYQPALDTAWISLPLIGWAMVHGFDPVHPRGDAWVVCLSTAALILAPSRLLQSEAAWARPLRWIGDRSYSLYLVHWPLIALARSVWMEGTPWPVQAGLLLMSFVLAHGAYVWIEQPLRGMASAQALGQRLLWFIVPLALAGSMMWMKLHPPAQPTSPAVDWHTVLQPNYGFARRCDQERDFKPHPACQSQPHPRTLVWGDSYAMHLVPALLASAPPGGIQQATRSACAPLLDMARRMPDEPAHRASRCLSFNESVLAHLRQSPHIEYVVISARWQYLFTDPVFDAHGHRQSPRTDTVAASLGHTLQRVRAMGKKVILISPPASAGPEINLGLCAERRAMGLWTVSPSTDAHCGFAQARHVAQHAQVLSMLSQAAQDSRTHLIRLDDVTCPKGRCQAFIDGIPLYRDAGHLSREGGRRLGLQMDLASVVARQAR
ncbi:MAG: acyltransferase family protein [Aquabacterium sp.]